MVSELVTNAVRHAAPGPVVIEVFLTRTGRVRVQVSDSSNRLPQLRDLDRGSLDGRGLQIVAGLAAVWGVDPLPGDGRTVWCEVPI